MKPEVHDGFEIEVRGGRHPVVEALSGEEFVPNDLSLGDSRFLMILTGPNMGGKSTFLRQTALHAVMSQMGSFVPAESARLPVVDRVFAPRRSIRRPLRRTVHVPHGNGGNRAHPPSRDESKPRLA